MHASIPVHFDRDCQNVKKYTQTFQTMQKITLFQKPVKKPHAKRRKHALHLVQHSGGKFIPGKGIKLIVKPNQTKPKWKWEKFMHSQEVKHQVN